MANGNPHLKVMAGFSRRFDASYRDAKAKVVANEIGDPFIIRSQTCDLVDNTGFFVRYAAKNGGMFVDCCIVGTHVFSLVVVAWSQARHTSCSTRLTLYFTA